MRGSQSTTVVGMRRKMVVLSTTSRTNFRFVSLSLSKGIASKASRRAARLEVAWYASPAHTVGAARVTMSRAIAQRWGPTARPNRERPPGAHASKDISPP